MSGHKRLANAESMLQQSGRKQTFQSSAWQTTNIFYTFANIFYKSAAVPSCGQWVRNFTPVQPRVQRTKIEGENEKVVDAEKFRL